jgi:hypothetical protein
MVTQPVAPSTTTVIDPFDPSLLAYVYVSAMQIVGKAIASKMAIAVFRIPSSDSARKDRMAIWPSK